MRPILLYAYGALLVAVNVVVAAPFNNATAHIEEGSLQDSQSVTLLSERGPERRSDPFDLLLKAVEAIEKQDPTLTATSGSGPLRQNQHLRRQDLRMLRKLATTDVGSSNTDGAVAAPQRRKRVLKPSGPRQGSERPEGRFKFAKKGHMGASTDRSTTEEASLTLYRMKGRDKGRRKREGLPTRTSQKLMEDMMDPTRSVSTTDFVTDEEFGKYRNAAKETLKAFKAYCAHLQSSSPDSNDVRWAREILDDSLSREAERVNDGRKRRPRRTDDDWKGSHKDFNYDRNIRYRVGLPTRTQQVRLGKLLHGEEFERNTRPSTVEGGKELRKEAYDLLEEAVAYLDNQIDEGLTEESKTEESKKRAKIAEIVTKARAQYAKVKKYSQKGKEKTSTWKHQQK